MPVAHDAPLVGLVPMAGQARRLGQLECSKEIYPLNNPAGAPRSVCEHLLGKMRDAGVGRVYIVLRAGKWDIPGHLGDGSALGLKLAYLMMNLPYGTPFSADQAYAFVRDARVAFGFPDMLFGDENIFATLLQRHRDSHADVVLGLFPADRPHKVDMVAVDGQGIVQRIDIKPPSTTLTHTWGVALWTPAFTQFLHDYIADCHAGTAAARELYIGDVVQAAMTAGLRVEAIPVSTQPFLDIGTPEDLARIRKCAE